MIYERFRPLSQLRCVCGEIGLIPDELRNLFMEAPKAEDYELIERVTGFKALFPEMPSHKLVWLCPSCWVSMRKDIKQIVEKLGGLYDFSLSQLSGIKIELAGQSFTDEVENARRRFVDNTDKWRGDKCGECGYRHSKLEKCCPRCGCKKKEKK